jgi:hypothetical protein
MLNRAGSTSFESVTPSWDRNVAYCFSFLMEAD